MINDFNFEAKQLLEKKLKDLCRKNHAEWAMYVFSSSSFNPDKTLTISVTGVQRLKKLMNYEPDRIIITNGPNPKEEVKKIVKIIKSIKPHKPIVLEENPIIKEVIDAFVEYSLNIKNIEPIITVSKVKERIENALKRYSVDQIKDIFDFYLYSDLSTKPGCNINAALSDFIINKWEEKR